ncbi:hypothetical protein IE4771_CH03859 [Rhizobium etli bv. mimosae str. IE4771]|uniref:Uncharacterized protein n=1 Tax=Rhizobium etli bv. mimosae str. IE4771 TaxID=1432050 RepID=A0A060I585_RHIET|nr:hypothetical protein [Rhizobium sp. IE4771]AIC28924.1 hypothetical protein IE4771_CH03859 [Rhizobium sp. IE4771]
MSTSRWSDPAAFSIAENAPGQNIHGPIEPTKRKTAGSLQRFFDIPMIGTLSSC